MGDKRVRIYRCADDEVGIFSAIYEAGISGYGHKYIKIQPQSADYMYSMELFADYIDVESSIKKMNSVLDAIKEKISHEAYEYVMKAIVSGDAGRGDVIYQFITYGFTLGAKVVMAVQFQEVADMFTLVRSVQNEAYRYIEVLRFKEVIHKPPLLLSVIEPKHDIVAHLANHFADRFNSEWFIIYDARHHKAVFHEAGGKWEVRLLSENEEQRLKELNETEEEDSDLWKVFFENIAVKERENKKLQTGNLPLRFREHMTEFEK